MVKTVEVTECLRFFVDTFVGYTTDEDNYVTTRDTTRITLRENGDEKELILYQEQIKDTNAMILNPFAEGLGDVISTNWFYRTNQKVMSNKIIVAMKSVMQMCLADKTKKTKDNEPYPLWLVDLMSVVVNDVDEKLIEEFDTITKDDLAFVNIVYAPRQIMAYLRCGLFENDRGTPWRDKFTKIRKKSWTVFETLFNKLLKTEGGDLRKFDYKETELGCVKFSSIMNTTFRIYSEINDILDYKNIETSVNLGEFRKHLNMFPAYFQNAKSMLQPSFERKAVPVQQSSGVPAPQPIMGQTPVQQNMVEVPAGSVVIPGPKTLDGRTLPPTVVPAAVAAMGGGMMAVPNMYGMAPQPIPNMGMQQYYQPMPQQQVLIPNMMGMAPQMQYQMPMMAGGIGSVLNTNMPMGLPGMPIIR